MTKLNQLLGLYRSLIQFEDKMESSNYKWVNSAILFYQRKDKESWIENSVELLEGAIANLNRYKKIHKEK